MRAGIREQGLGTTSDCVIFASVCCVTDCGRSLAGGRDGMCVECAGMDENYEEYFAKQRRRQMSGAAERLKTTALVAVFVVLMSWLAVEAFPSIWFAFKMWGK
jgi:hypothetical protein